MRAVFALIVLVALAGCPREPRRIDQIILLSQPDAQERIDSATANGFRVIEDNDLQARTDAVFLWKFVRD